VILQRLAPDSPSTAVPWLCIDEGGDVQLDAGKGDRFRVFVDQPTRISAYRGASGQTIQIRLEQDVDGGHAVTFGTLFVARGTVPPIPTTALAVSLYEATWDDGAEVWELRGVGDLSAVYDAVGAAAAAQAAAEAFATAADAVVLAAAEGYADSAVAALSAVYQPLDSDLTAIAALTTTAFGRGLLELANAGALQAAAGMDSTINVTIAYQVAGTQVVGPRGAAVADATGAGDVVARLNDLLSRLRTHGLIDV
jgi:hypothetical protein